MHLGRGPAIQRAMRTFVVVEPEIGRKPRFEFRHRAIVPKIDILVLDTAPEPLDKHIIQRPATAVHADQDLVVQQRTGEVRTGELTALIGVEDARLSLRQGLLERLRTEQRIQGIG